MHWSPASRGRLRSQSTGLIPGCGSGPPGKHSRQPSAMGPGHHWVQRSHLPRGRRKDLQVRARPRMWSGGATDKAAAVRRGSRRRRPWLAGERGAVWERQRREASVCPVGHHSQRIPAVVAIPIKTDSTSRSTSSSCTKSWYPPSHSTASRCETHAKSAKKGPIGCCLCCTQRFSSLSLL